MNQLPWNEPYSPLKPVIGDIKLKAVTEMCYLCRRLSSIASQVENLIREPSGLPLAGFWNMALNSKIWWHPAWQSSLHHNLSSDIRIPVLQRPLILEIYSRATGKESPNCSNKHTSTWGESRRVVKTCVQITWQYHMSFLSWNGSVKVQQRVACYKARMRTVYEDIMKKGPKPGIIVLSWAGSNSMNISGQPNAINPE